MGQNIRQLESQATEVEAFFARLQQEMATVEERLDESRSQIDARIGEAEQRLNAADTQRATAFESGQEERSRLARDLHQVKTEEWEGGSYQPA